MGKDELPIYEFEDFRLDAEKYILSRAGETLSLTPKVFETLLLPMKRAGEVLKKDELLRAVWTDAILEENNLNQYISALRRCRARTAAKIATLQPFRGRATGSFRMSAHREKKRRRSRGRCDSAFFRLKTSRWPAIGNIWPTGLTDETIAALGLWYALSLANLQIPSAARRAVRSRCRCWLSRCCLGRRQQPWLVNAIRPCAENGSVRAGLQSGHRF